MNLCRHGSVELVLTIVLLVLTKLVAVQAALEWPLLLCDSPMSLLCANIGKIPKRWPTLQSSRIPYIVQEDNFTTVERLMIHRSIGVLNQLSCVRFVRWSSREPSVTLPAGTAFLRLTKWSVTDSCSATGGYHGGVEHVVRLHSNCLAPSEDHVAGSLLHELLHVLGFVHEHQRPDRDDYVVVRFDRVRPGEHRNFRRFSGTVLNQVVPAYDHRSIMHYELDAFAEEPKLRTIEPIVVNQSNWLMPALEQIGTRRVMSPFDVLRLNRAYNCDRTECRHELGHSTMVGDYAMQTCANHSHTLVGSIARRCLYGGIWTGLPAKCLVADNELQLNYCNFEDAQWCSSLLAQSTHWKVSPVYALPVSNLRYDLSTGNLSGHVVTLNASEANGEDDEDGNERKLHSHWFSYATNSSVSYCFSFGYFLSSEQIHLRVSLLSRWTEMGEKANVTQHFGATHELFASYYQQCLSGRWIAESFVLRFNANQIKISSEFSLLFEVNHYHKNHKDHHDAHLVALDEVSLYRSESQCDGHRIVI